MFLRLGTCACMCVHACVRVHAYMSRCSDGTASFVASIREVASLSLLDVELTPTPKVAFFCLRVEGRGTCAGGREGEHACTRMRGCGLCMHQIAEVKVEVKEMKAKRRCRDFVRHEMMATQNKKDFWRRDERGFGDDKEAAWHWRVFQRRAVKP